MGIVDLDLMPCCPVCRARFPEGTARCPRDDAPLEPGPASSEAGAQTRRGLARAALVASVLLVLLVVVVLGVQPRPGLPLAPSVASQVAPLPPDVTLPSASAPPATSSAPLSAIPRPSGTALVVVLTTPSGATVSRDGRPIGLAPGPFALPAGSARVSLTITAAGYLPAVVDVVPADGRTLNAVLKKAAPSRGHAAARP